MKKQYILPLGLFLVGVFILYKRPPHIEKGSRHPPPASEIPVAKYKDNYQNKRSTQSQAGRKALLNKEVNQQSFKAPYSYFSSQLKHFQECLKTKECPQYEQTDEKSYEVGVHQEIKTTLDTLDDWIRRHNFKDEKISPLMRELLAVDSGAVKLSVLKIMSTQNPEAKNLDSILRDVFGSYHVQPIRLGLTELSRYKDPVDQKYIHNHLQYTLLKGSLHVAEELAENIDLLIEKPSRYQYDSLLSELKRMPINEDVYIALNRSLRKMQ